MARYWVWWTGNWSDATNHWATTSGGAPGAGNLPTASDDVIFDTLSNATAYTCTIDTTTKLCRDITFWAPLVGNMTWAWSVAMTISWSMTLYSGLVRTYTGALTFNATTTGKTLTFAGSTWNSTIIFNGAGGEWTIQDTLTSWGGSLGITLTTGSLITNNQTVAFWVFNANNSNTKSLTLGSSTITCTQWIIQSGGTTFSAGTSTITGTSTNQNFLWGLTYYNWVFTGSGGRFDDTNTFTNLTYTWPANKTSTFITVNQTITGTLTINGNSAINRLLVLSTTFGTARTLTAANVSVTNTDFQDIIGAWAGSWDLSAITGWSGDCGGNSGITFTTPATQTATGTASFTWSTHWWTSRVPLPQDPVSIPNAFVATRVVTMDMPRAGWDITFSCSGSPTLTPSIGVDFYGSLDLTWVAAFSGIQALLFRGRGSCNFNGNSLTHNGTVGINCASGTYTLTGDFTCSSTFSVLGGTLNTGTNKTLISSVWAFTWSGGNIVHGAGSIIQSTDNGITITSTGTMTADVTSILKISSNSTSIRSFNSNGINGKTYGILWFANATASGGMQILWDNTFYEIRMGLEGTAQNLQLRAWSTTTVTNFNVNGASGNLVTISSQTGSTATHAIVKSGGWTISCDYLNIQHSVATPSSTWYAWTNSTNNQSVATVGSGWIFTAPPAPWWTTRKTLWLLGVG